MVVAPRRRQVQGRAPGGALDHQRQPLGPLPDLPPPRASACRATSACATTRHAPLPHLLQELPLRAADDERDAARWAETYEPWVGEERTYYETDAARGRPRATPSSSSTRRCASSAPAASAPATRSATPARSRWPAAASPPASPSAPAARIHESNCDFCGACIDVCPTATLMEKPNKWIATHRGLDEHDLQLLLASAARISIGIAQRPGRHRQAGPPQPRQRRPDLRPRPLPLRRRRRQAAPARSTSCAAAPPGRRSSPRTGASWSSTPPSRSRPSSQKHGAQARSRCSDRPSTRTRRTTWRRSSRATSSARRTSISAPPRRTAPPRRRSRPRSARRRCRRTCANIAQSDVIICHRRRPRVEPQRRRAAHQGCHRRQPRRAAQRQAACSSPRSGARWPTSRSRTAASGCARDPADEAAGRRRAGEGRDARRARSPPATRATRAAVLAAPATPRRPASSIVYAPSPVDAAARRQRRARLPRTSPSRCAARRPRSRCTSCRPRPTSTARATWASIPSAAPAARRSHEPGMDFDAMIDAAIAGTLKAMVVVGDNPLMFAPDTARVAQALGVARRARRHRQPAHRHGEGRARRLRRRPVIREDRHLHQRRAPRRTACTPRSTRSATRARRCSRSPTWRTRSAAPTRGRTRTRTPSRTRSPRTSPATSASLGRIAFWGKTRVVSTAVEGRAAAGAPRRGRACEGRAAADHRPHAVHEPRRRGDPRAGRRQAAPRRVRRAHPRTRRRCASTAIRGHSWRRRTAR